MPSQSNDPFNKCLLSTYYMPDTVPGTRDIGVKDSGKAPSLMSLLFWWWGWEETLNTQHELRERYTILRKYKGEEG